MYLPLELNTPALVGGFLAHFLGKRKPETGRQTGRHGARAGVIIASGFDGRGALGGVSSRGGPSDPRVQRGLGQDVLLRR